jgi:hypothetical protein
MTAQRAKHTKVWIEGYVLTSRISDTAPSCNFDEAECSGFGQDKGYVKGQADSALPLDGYFSEDTGSTHEALKNAGTDGQMLITLAMGNNAAVALGDITCSLMAEQFNYQPNSDLKGVIAVHADFKCKGKTLEFGNLLADVTVTANGNQASVDNSAGSSNGGVGYLHILGLSSGDTITVKVQHSTDDSAWSDLITFTLDGSALDAERIEVSGTVNRYVRASYTVTGSSISFPIAVVFVRK